MKTLGEEDEGLYNCRSFQSSGEELDHAAHQLELMSEYLYSSCEQYDLCGISIINI